MNAAAVKILKEAGAKMASGLIKYLRDDAAHSYALEETFTALIEGVGVGKICADYKTKDGAFEVRYVSVSEVVLVCYPFPASSNLWNGPDIIGDTEYSSMAASLVHDLIWGHSAELAFAWGVSPNRVLAWGNDVLYAIWKEANGGKPTALSRIAYHVCDLAAPFYHRFKRLLGLGTTATACLAILAGCRQPPEGWSVKLTGTNAVWRAIEAAKDGNVKPIFSAPGTVAPGGAAVSRNFVVRKPGAGESLSPEDAPDSFVSKSSNAKGGTGGNAQGRAGDASSDAVDFAALSWKYGGFDGKSSKPVPNCEISALSVSKGGLAYKWAQGGCEALGAASKTDAACLACLFVQDAAGNWRGGKFDWISTSRTSRDFKNIAEGYNGWPKDAIETARAYAFVIVSKDGKRRSNVIAVGK